MWHVQLRSGKSLKIEPKHTVFVVDCRQHRCGSKIDPMRVRVAPRKACQGIRCGWHIVVDNVVDEVIHVKEVEDQRVCLVN